MSFAQNTAWNHHFHWALMCFEFIGFTLNHDYDNVIICPRVISFFEEILPMTHLYGLFFQGETQSLLHVGG